MHVTRMVVSFALAGVVGACGSVSNMEKPDAKPATADARASDAAIAIDAAIDGMTQPFTPAQLSGLSLWLDANQSVVTSQSKVSTWMDRSGKNNNAGQSVATYQPSLVTGVVNGLPVIRFLNTTLQVTDSATLQWATDDFALFVVGGYKNTTTSGLGYGMFVAKQLVPYPYAGPALWGNYTAPSLNTVIGLQADGSGTQYTISTAAKNDGVIRLYTGRRVGNSLEVRVNGTVQGSATTTANNVSAAGRPLYIGGQPNTNGVFQPLDGDIAEIVAVHGTLTTAELTQVETYLKAKYALP
ncbi:MAG TPA: hypothetical protein VIV11_03790 [Kofleriaceae bacterium]